MTGDGGGKIGKYVEPLKTAGFGNREQAGGGQFAVGAAISETDFAHLNQRPEFSFGSVIGRLNAFLFDKQKQPWDVIEQHGGEISHIATGTIQMALAQGE